MSIEFSWKIVKESMANEIKTQKMLGCFNPNLGQIRTNPNVGLKF